MAPCSNRKESYNRLPRNILTAALVLRNKGLGWKDIHRELQLKFDCFNLQMISIEGLRGQVRRLKEGR